MTCHAVALYCSTHDARIMEPIVQRLRHDPRFRLSIVSTVESMRESDTTEIPYAPHSTKTSLQAPYWTVVVDPELAYSQWYSNEAQMIADEAEAAFRKAGSWLRTLDPDVIIACASPTPPIREIVFAARMLGIPTVNAEHGVSSHVRLDLDDAFTLRFQGKWAEALLFDHFACWGESIRDVMIREGSRSDRLFVSGAPDFDRIDEYRTERFRRESRSQLGLDPNIRVLAFPGRPFLHAAREYAEFCLRSREEIASWYHILFAALYELPDTMLIVKNHPSLGGKPEEEFQKALAPKNANVRWTDPDGDIWRFLAAADEVVTHPGSTTDFHALALGRPLISLMLPEQTQRYMIVEYGLSPCARDSGSLVKFLSEPPPPPPEPLARFLDRYLGPLDGRAAARIADRLAEIAAGRSEYERP